MNDSTYKHKNTIYVPIFVCERSPTLHQCCNTDITFLKCWERIKCMRKTLKICFVIISLLSHLYYDITSTHFTKRLATTLQLPFEVINHWKTQIPNDIFMCHHMCNTSTHRYDCGWETKKQHKSFCFKHKLFQGNEDSKMFH